MTEALENEIQRFVYSTSRRDRESADCEEHVSCDRNEIYAKHNCSKHKNLSIRLFIGKLAHQLRPLSSRK